MPIGICCALTSELRTLTRQKAQIGDVISRGPHVLLILSGMGPARARIAAEQLIERGVQALFSWGSAAALDERLTPGTLLIPRNVIDSKGRPYSVSRAWSQRLLQRLASHVTINRGAIVGCTQVLTHTTQKYELLKRYRASAADMESVAIAKVARQHHVTFVAVRAISDTAQMAIPPRLTTAVNGVGQTSLLSVCTHVLPYPRDWIKVVKLGWGMHRALSALKQAAKWLPKGFPEITDSQH
jgi:adenosylhomocysteine nucleosidase